MNQTPNYCLYCLALLFCLSQANLTAQSIPELQHSFDLAKKQGDFKTAIPFAEKIVVLLEQAGNSNQVLYAQKLIQLSGAYNQDFRRIDAEKASLKAIQLHPQADTLHANALMEWCYAAGGQGQFVRADSIASLALNLRRQLLGEDNLLYITTLYTVGFMQFRSGNISNAINALEQCKQLWNKNRPGSPEVFAQTLTALGTCYVISGKPNKAAQYYQESIATRRANPELDQVTFVETANLASILIAKGQYAEADQYLADLEKKMREKGLWGNARYSDIFLIKAQLLSQLNRYEEAIAAAKEGRALNTERFGTNNPDLFRYDNVIANILWDQGKNKESAMVLRNALDSMRVQGTQNKLDYLELKTGLAQAYLADQDYHTAINILLEVVNEYEKAGNQGLDFLVKSAYLGLAQNYRFISDYTASRESLQKFESIIGPEDTHFNWGRFLAAELCWVEKNFTQVLPLLNTYIENIKSNLSREVFLFDDQKRQSQFENLQAPSHALLALCRADMAPHQVPALMGLTMDFELFRKSLLLTTTKKMRTSILTSNDEVLKQNYTKWLNLREDLAYYYTQQKEVLQAENIEIPKLEAAVDSLDKVLARGSAAFRNTANHLNVNWQALRGALQPGQAALEIVRFQGQIHSPKDSVHYAIFVLNPELPEPALVFITDGNRLENVVAEKHLAACNNPASPTPDTELYDLVWKAIEPHLKNAKTIYVSADGCFHKINFATLRQANQVYLADRYNFRNVFSLKDILKEENPSANNQNTSAFLLGNPAFSPQVSVIPQTPGRNRSVTERQSKIRNHNAISTLDIPGNFQSNPTLELKALPYSQKEVINLAALLQRNGWSTKVFTGAQAKEEEIKAVNKPRVLHLATHGYFLTNERGGLAGLNREAVVRNPLLRAMLFFAGAQQTLDQKELNSKEDGILSAYEVQNLDLEGTELVVLSACKTGQGKILNGEGVYGLQRSFRVAGAQSLLISLWDLDDVVGQLFVQNFYEQWLSGQSKAEAFHRAQLMIKSKYPHPFYWGGFLLIGD